MYIFMNYRNPNHNSQSSPISLHFSKFLLLTESRSTDLSYDVRQIPSPVRSNWRGWWQQQPSSQKPRSKRLSSLACGHAAGPLSASVSSLPVPACHFCLGTEVLTAALPVGGRQETPLPAPKTAQTCTLQRTKSEKTSLQSASSLVKGFAGPQGSFVLWHWISGEKKVVFRVFFFFSQTEVTCGKGWHMVVTRMV